VSVQMLAKDVLSSSCSGVLASRELLAVSGTFDPTLSCCADWDMFLRMAQHSPLASVNRPLLGYRVHPSSLSAKVRACGREIEVVCARYEALREARGAVVDRPAWELWKAAGYLRAGDRGGALRSFFASARADHDWRQFARSALVTALPGGPRLRERRQKRRVPESWRAEAESWLAPYLGGAATWV
jgi:hypothetical protein